MSGDTEKKKTGGKTAQNGSKTPQKTKNYKTISGEDKFRLFMLKYEGAKITELAVEFNINLRVLYEYFQKGGIWVTEYKDFEKNLNDEMIEEAKSILKKGVKSASQALILSLASGDGNVRVRAANSILEREFGKAKQPIEGTGGFTLKVNPVEIAKMVEDLKREGVINGGSPDTTGEFSYDGGGENVEDNVEGDA
ncbi:MAG: hypothetical protein M0R80_18380 [Proteobacteria bacterium]|jgi:hypothetical protein|nr:hypothetical protein [Pseudomonadota bacterium]